MTTNSHPKVSGTTGRDGLPFIDAELGFLGAEPQVARIHDARPILDELSLDREGFTMIKHESELANQNDPELLRREARAYLEDMAPTIKEVMGASWVVGRHGGVVVRSATKIDPANPEYARNRGGIEVPFPNVHLDYTRESAVQLARGENFQQGLPERPFSRLVIIQAWRATSAPPQDRPLALMDASTLGPDDTYAAGPPLDPDDLSTDNFQPRLVHFKPEHRWYYFPEMVPSEVLLFKGHDSDAKRDAAAPHSSFLNESLGSRALPRESVEGRYFVYYE